MERGDKRSICERYDVVLYGATGFTGGYILRAVAGSPLFKDKTIAVAGRNGAKLKKALDDLAEETGNHSVICWPFIIADSSEEASLPSMARRARVIINAVGPFHLHGEAVVKAAVENGANYVDISGEPAFLEKVQLHYNDQARENGVYIVGACGFDSIPCDLGVEYLKGHFPGTLAYAETVIRLISGPSGYALNSGTYQSMILGIASKRHDNLAALHRSVMPQELPKPAHLPPTRVPLWHCVEGEYNMWVMPFMGADKSIVERSQYHDFHVNGRRPVPINTYIGFDSFIRALLIAKWMAAFAALCWFEPTRKMLMAHPDRASLGMFKAEGPTHQQIKEASFEYYFFGTGWGEEEKARGSEERRPPTKKCSAVCRGPDVAYTAASGCVVASALALLNDHDKLPEKGGVYTSAAAFRDTKIFEYLKSFNISFEML